MMSSLRFLVELFLLHDCVCMCVHEGVEIWAFISGSGPLSQIPNHADNGTLMLQKWYVGGLIFMLAVACYTTPLRNYTY